MRGSLLILTLLGSVAAQLDAGVPGITVGDSVFNGSRVCNQTFADTNITGVAAFNPAVGANTGDVRWAATVYQTPNTTVQNEQLTELSLWFSPGTANYTNNANLGFDACYLWISSASYNTWQRGQNDTGGCVQTLDDQCVNDMNALTTQNAIWLTGSPDGNLTADSLPGVCDTLADTLTDNFPSSCKPFFNAGVRVYGSPPALGGPLTGSDSFVKRAQCTLEDESTNSTYALMWSQFGAGGSGVYDLGSWFVTPVITTFFPIADENRIVTVAYAKSFMSCIRASKVNAGSQPVPNAPLPTPINTSSNSTSNSSTNSTDILGAANSTTTSPESTSTSNNNTGGISGGAIAGIAIGVIFGVLALVALLAFILFRKRIQEKLAKRKSGKQFAEMDTATAYAEMENGGPAMEVPNTSISEMGGDTRRMVELGGIGKVVPVELPADSRPGKDAR